MTPQHFFRALWILSASYLAWRAIVAAYRIRWARRAYPVVAAPKHESTSLWANRCRGCLVAGGIGDALNLPAESVPRRLARLRYPAGPRMRRGIVRFLRNAGDISDDTQLTIAVARSLDATGSYCHQRFIDELARWSYFRIGAGRSCTKASLQARRQSPVSANQSKGNGAAIRVAPFAIAAINRKRLIEHTQQNAQATHNTQAAIQGAVFVSLLLYECLRRAPGFLDDQLALDATIADISEASKFSIRERNDNSAPSGHVEECIPAVLRVLRAHGSDLREAMKAIFNGGGDTDSIGAIVGSCIGAQIGYDALPKQWTAPLQHHDYLVWLADRLATPAQPKQYQAQLVELSGDISLRKVDALVNAWNRNLIPPWLLIPQGVSKALKKAGGANCIRQIGRAGPLPLGNALESPAGELDAKWVIHSDAINLVWRASEDSIRQATRSSLQLAHWLGVRTIALPLLGAGSGSFSAAQARDIIKSEAEAMRHDFDRIEIVSLPAK